MLNIPACGRTKPTRPSGQPDLRSVHLLLLDPADELVLLGLELQVQLLRMEESSARGLQIPVQLPLPLSGHQELPVEHRCSRKEQNHSRVGPPKHSCWSVFIKMRSVCAPLGRVSMRGNEKVCFYYPGHKRTIMFSTTTL